MYHNPYVLIPLCVFFLLAINLARQIAFGDIQVKTARPLTWLLWAFLGALHALVSAYTNKDWLPGASFGAGCLVVAISYGTTSSYQRFWKRELKENIALFGSVICGMLWLNVEGHRDLRLWLGFAALVLASLPFAVEYFKQPDPEVYAMTFFLLFIDCLVLLWGIWPIDSLHRWLIPGSATVFAGFMFWKSIATGEVKDPEAEIQELL